MKLSLLTSIAILLLSLSNLQQAFGLRFTVDREECFSHNVQHEHKTVHVSFVVINSDAPWHTDKGVDLVVKGPEGNQIQDIHDKISQKFEFVADKKGPYSFCFTNKSPYHETIDFDVQVAHFTYYDEYAKDEHVKPLIQQIEKLAEALEYIQFEQHWLEAETDRQAVVNEAMTKRAVHKATVESLGLVGASALQIYLLRQLFERKLGTSRV